MHGVGSSAEAIWGKTVFLVDEDAWQCDSTRMSAIPLPSERRKLKDLLAAAERCSARGLRDCLRY